MNIIVHGDSCLISSVNLSITIANKKWLRADLWHLEPIHLSNRRPHHCHTALIYILHIYLTSVPLPTSSYNTTSPLFLFHMHSLNPQRQIKLFPTFSIHLYQCSQSNPHICRALSWREITLLLTNHHLVSQSSFHCSFPSTLYLCSLYRFAHHRSVTVEIKFQ